MTVRSSTLRLAAAVASTACLVLLAAWSLKVQREDQGRMPSAETTTTLNQTIRDEWQPRDAVRVRPLWFADARLNLPGLPVLMSDVLDEYDRHRFDRLWLAYSTSHAAEADEDRAWLVNTTVIVDQAGYRIERGEIVPGPEVLWDGYETVQQAQVTRTQRDGGTSVCDRWLHDSWHCQRYNQWIFVGATFEEVDDTPRACIQANAPDRGDRWSIHWPDVPFGQTLRMRAGNTLQSLRTERGTPVQLTALVNGEVVLEHAFGIDEFGYPEFIINTAQWAGQRGTLEFHIGAEDHFDRFFCFRPQTLSMTLPPT